MKEPTEEIKALQDKWDKHHLNDKAAMVMFNWNAFRNGYHETRDKKPCIFRHDRVLNSLKAKNACAYAFQFKKLVESFDKGVHNTFKIIHNKAEERYRR